MMKQRRRGLACLSLAFVLLFAACGGRQSVASRSAAAYDGAKRKGTPVEGGHKHDGHAAGDAEAHPADSQMPAMDHSTTPGAAMNGMDHSTMQSDHATAMDHSKMPADGMTGMDHSTTHNATSGMHSQPHAASMPAMDHSKMQSGGMAAMDHSVARDGAMPGMQHGASAAVVATPPSSTTDLARVDPKATLSPDSFDAPSRVSMAEAVKAANNVPDGEIRHIVPGQDRENPPTPQPAFRGQTPSAIQHSTHGASVPAVQQEAAVYTCPMHPEVTSNRPGSCPKCGMTLVKKEKQQ